MPSHSTTLPEIINRCGGRERLAKALRLHPRSIGNWTRAGFPPCITWPVITRISDVTFKELDRLWAESAEAKAWINSNTEEST